MTLPLLNTFRSIVLENRPLIDVRAPIEFAKGAFPGSINLPLMSDEERHAVGITYKKEGNAAAVTQGHRLVSGELRSQRVQAWIDHISAQPESCLYCSRGGQRSQIAQQWIAEAGIVIPRLEGGYKAFRNYLLEALEHITLPKQLYILGGHTGSGKTILLNRLEESIDLEGLANHRGSSFGRYATPQPTQIDFENSLAYALIRYFAQGHQRLILEDESHNIGRCYIPAALFAQMKEAPVILLERSIEERIEITYAEYILASQADYARVHAEGGIAHSWIETMRHNFQRIRKRLGDQGYRELLGMLDHAWGRQQRTGDPSEHKQWIEALLRRYYDPMYAYQIEQKGERVVFRGNESEIEGYFGMAGK